MSRIVFLAVLAAAYMMAQGRAQRWVVLMDSPPVATQVANRQALSTNSVQSARLQIQADHGRTRQAIESRGAQVTGESTTLLNAIYFRGTDEDAASLRGLPGVRGVVRMRYYRRTADDQAISLMNGPAAWNAVGGAGNAGLNRRIGIIDAGVDQTHPTLQDSSLAPPGGFPRGDSGYTSQKVIVARSYVNMLVDAAHPDNSRPDDLSPRDRDGHGTAIAMLAAGVRTDGPAATVSGMAPKAFIGNYKIFGSPGLNDYTTDDVVVQALTDALADGMDVVTLSLGTPADWGPLDDCLGTPCDPLASTIENAARLGLAVVTGAGNDGDVGAPAPTLGTIQSPGTAPSAITVGATTNGQIYYQRLTAPNLQPINGMFGSGPVPGAALTGAVVDVASLNEGGTACQPLEAGAIAGRIALINRGGSCTLADKVNYAQSAGAIAVVMVNLEGQNWTVRLDGLQGTGIPAMLIGNADGGTLRTYLQGNPNAQITLDPALTLVPQTADRLAYFSSRGPTIGTYDIKPELTAVGTDLYMAAQNYDPNGTLFSQNRYIAAQGTSLSVPLVAGAVALVKQQNPNWTGADLKSAVVNSANPNINAADANGNFDVARTTATGAGKLDAAKALTPAITAEPATIGFGPYGGGAITRTLRIRNKTSAAVPVNLTVQQRDPDNNAQVTFVGGSSDTLPPNGSRDFQVRLGGTVSSAGSYDGVIVATAGTTSLRIPYLYLVGDGVPYTIYPLRGDGLVEPAGSELPFNTNNGSGVLTVKVLDRLGVPVDRQAIRWTVASGNGSITNANATTDNYGVATAGAILGQSVGEQIFRAEAGSINTIVALRTVLQPTIDNGGVVDAASFRLGQGLQPGSYISIFGQGLSDVSRTFTTPYLPIALSNVSVSFDDLSSGKSFPGGIHFINSNQVNVQIPWEMFGSSNVQLKVSRNERSYNGLSTVLVTVPLAAFSPGFFERDETGRRIVVAQDQAFQVVGATNPVARGQVLQLYVNGLGAVTNQPASGQPAPSNPLSETNTRPEVTIGGVPAAVQFSGLAPTLIGCYQVNVTVPANAPVGVQPITLSIGGVTAQASLVPIR